MARTALILMGLAAALLLSPAGAVPTGEGVRLKEIARVAGVRDNPLTGYGLVVGLAGTGDSARNQATVQSVVNALGSYGVNVVPGDLNSRNVAAVIVTATLPPFSEPGQVLDVQVASIGDARSLAGGTLLITPLYGPDERLYALSQGAVSVGGYQIDAPGAFTRRNHPNAGRVPNGATVEQAAPVLVGRSDGRLDIVLNQADFTSAQRIADALGRSLPGLEAYAEHAGKVVVETAGSGLRLVELVSRIENLRITPDSVARVVVNERTGTVVAGGEVRIANVSISHGDLRVEVSTDYLVSQPGGLLIEPSDSIATVVVPRGVIQVEESDMRVVAVPEGTTVAELVGALRGIRLSTRDVITILQSIKAAGALHGELVIQ